MKVNVEAGGFNGDARSPEIMQPQMIGIATATRYPRWYPGSLQEGQHDADKVRGDLALRLLTTAKDKKFHVTVVDGGSSDAFKQRVRESGIVVSDERERGMSAGRRQAFRETSAIPGVEVVCWTEPEKVSIIDSALPGAVVPLLQKEADIVVPQRDERAFATYPPYQARYEQEANKVWNGILRQHNLLPEGAPDLDAWIGPRFFRNVPSVRDIFQDVYEFDQRQQSYYQMVNPELWPNALFLPIVAALHRGLRVVGMPIDYQHPPEQTHIEQDSPLFEAKRQEQFRNILVTTSHFVSYLEGRQKRLQPVS